MHDSTDQPPNVMDRFSDWLGSFIPGGYRLQSRHPVKVSLVMGSLWFVAGWVAPLLSLGMLNACGLEHIAAAVWVPGIVLGGLVYVPLLIWRGASSAYCQGVLLLAVIAGLPHIWMLMQIRRFDLQPMSFAVVGLTCGMAYALVGLTVDFRRKKMSVLGIALIAGLTHWMFAVGANYCQSSSAPILYKAGGLMFLVASLFSPAFMAIGLVYSRSLWVNTPRPKFEPDAAG